MNAQTQQTPQPLKIEAAAGYCIVGCKTPHGLICQLFSTDGKNVVASHTIKGMNSARIVGGYGLTDGVPMDFMKAWLEQNAEHPAVKNGAVFIHTNVKGAEVRAKEGRGIKTGLEAIDPLDKARKTGLVIDKESEAAYRKQLAENPLRDRQIQE